MGEVETKSGLSDQKISYRTGWGGAAVSIVGAIITLFGIYIQATYKSFDKERELHMEFVEKERKLNVQFVEIGIGILETDPAKTGINPARKWAIKIIENNSGVTFSEKDKKLLEQMPLYIVPSYNSTYTPSNNSTYTPSARGASRPGQISPTTANPKR